MLLQSSINKFSESDLPKVGEKNFEIPQMYPKISEKNTRNN